MPERLGIIAGNGRLPLLIADQARQEGYEVVAVALGEEADRAIEKIAHRVYWIGITQLGRIIRTLRDEGVIRAVMAGQVTKRRMYLSDILRLDTAAARLWASLPDKKGMTILRAVADELQRHGIELQDSTLFMKPHLAVPGPMTGRRPSEAQAADVAFGFRAAKLMADEDIGQSVAVKDLSVVAVEAVEGTDACIRRAGELAGKGFVLVKVSMKNHDMRFDVPVIGMRTLETLSAAGAAVIAVEAGKTLILDRESVLTEADRLGLVVMGVS
jgi:DUF1009 family protein